MLSPFVPGSPTWLDVGSPDLAATTAFYQGLFGWEPVSLGPEAGGYGFFTQQGRSVAAYGPLAEGASSAWTVYFGTDDTDATARQAEQAGGTVRTAPFDVMTAGREAQLTDPAGARFALWQPRDTRGLDTVNDPGTLCWVELHTPDVAAARTFYATVFGWNVTEQEMGESSYGVLATGDETTAFGGLMPDEQPARWLPYFEVADCDTTAATAGKLGGSTVHGAESVPGVGRMALLSDTSGALFSVVTSATPGG